MFEGTLPPGGLGCGLERGLDLLFGDCADAGELGALRQADDAVLLDNSELNAEETIDAALQIIRSKVAL